MKITLFCRLNATLSAYQKAMKVSVTTPGAFLAPTTLATALQWQRQADSSRCVWVGGGPARWRP